MRRRAASRTLRQCGRVGSLPKRICSPDDGVLLDSARIDYGVRRFDWIALDAISTALIDAVIDGEDRRFWTHHGVDWRAAIGARATT